MLKKIKELTCILSLLVFQNINCEDHFSEKKIKEFSLRNGINIMLHEDFRTPIVLVGVIFHVGSIDAPLDKIGITELVAANLIDKKMHDSFMKYGISYEVSTFGEYTEVIAKMNPKKIDKFFNKISKMLSRIRVENLDMYKKQMAIENRLNNCFLNNALMDNVFSNIDSRNISNESSLSSIDESDVSDFYEDKFKPCKVSIIVVGSVGYKNLIKTLRSSISNIEDRTQTINHKKNHRVLESISLESKYMENSMRYAYSIPSSENNKIENVFFDILNHEAFRFFCKSHSLLSCYTIENIFNYEDRVWLFSMFPKKDVSLDKLQKLYKVFVNKMAMLPLDSHRLSSIAALDKMRTQVLFSNLSCVYDKIKNAYMRGIDLTHIYTISDDIKKADPKAIRSFAKKFFHKDLISTITTRFRSDK